MLQKLGTTSITIGLKVNNTEIPTIDGTPPSWALKYYSNTVKDCVWRSQMQV
jgi:hypothetical protein